MELHDLGAQSLALAALALPGAIARVLFALSREGEHFPGYFRGIAILVASVCLGITAGLLVANIDHTKGYEYAAAISVGWLAQDLQAWMVRKGKSPLDLIRAILTVLTKK